MNLKLARTEINAKPAEISLEKLEEEVETLLKIKRSHWNIEAQHWVLDVQLKEDGKAARKGNAMPTAVTLRRFCLAVRKHDSEYAERPVKRFFMADNHDIARVV